VYKQRVKTKEYITYIYIYIYIRHALTYACVLYVNMCNVHIDRYKVLHDFAHNTEYNRQKK